MGILIFILILVMAFLAELLDSSIGMGYGTLLAPILLLMGFIPVEVVPAILLSQVVGGFIAGCFHHKIKNADLLGNGRDRNISLIIILCSVAAIVFAVSISVKIPPIYTKTYISILVFVMGMVILFKKKSFEFKWYKVIIFGLVSSFNKAISGGGFGPIVTSGQVVSGRSCKNSVGVTTISEVPVCLLSFVTYLGMSGTSSLNYSLITALLIGAFLSAPIGPFITKKINTNKLKVFLALLLIVISIWSIIKIYIL